MNHRPTLSVLLALLVAGIAHAQEKGPSAADVARELSNPNTALASLNFKNQFRTFTGDLPNADDQSSYTLLFQPTFPFPFENGDKLIWRPALPVIVGQPVFNPDTMDFDSKSALGDFAFDLAYAPKTGGGLILALGLITSIPTATNDLGFDRWTLGPEFMIGKVAKSYVVGVFPNHQWDIAGSGKKGVSLTTIQPFATYLPGGGWNIGSGPIITYNWKSEQWIVPIQVNFGKTVTLGKTPIKLGLEVNYFADKPDGVGPEWMIGLNISPVVSNVLADLLDFD